MIDLKANKRLNDQTKELYDKQVQVLDVVYSNRVEEHINIVAMPDDKTIEKVLNIQNEIKEFTSNQYFFPPENLHLTIQTHIPTNKDIEPIKKVLSEFLKENTFTFDLYGLNSNHTQINLIAYPKGFDLKELRTKLAEVTDIEQDHYVNWSLGFGWISMVRFLSDLPKAAVDYIIENSKRDYGEMKADEIVIAKSRTKLYDDKDEFLKIPI